MTLNESIVEDAVLIMPEASLTQSLPLGEEQFRIAAFLLAFCLRPFPLRSGPQREKVTDQGKRVGQFRVAQTHTPALSHCEKVKRETIRRLNPDDQSRTLATLRNTLLPKLLSGELATSSLSGTI